VSSETNAAGVSQRPDKLSPNPGVDRMRGPDLYYRYLVGVEKTRGQVTSGLHTQHQELCLSSILLTNTEHRAGPA
jgi:hypothetical protein